MLSVENLVIVGDLNMTLHSFENWGTIHSYDPMAEYFIDIFKKYQLVDIVPFKITPTWRSKQEGVGVSKRLDRFFMKESLVDFCSSYKS